MPKDNPLSAENNVDLFNLYAKDPELAYELVFGRVPQRTQNAPVAVDLLPPRARPGGGHLIGQDAVL